jgi:SpoVK/Ycf46/Vps4 family AAA+-type ATPase
MSEKKIAYKNYGIADNLFIANKQAQESVPILPAGSYKVEYIEKYDFLSFEPMNLNSDNILELPSKEFTRVVNEMKQFLEPSIKEKYSKLGYLYKRSCLLHGRPGGGKSMIVNRVAREAIKNGAVVLFCSNPEYLVKAFSALNDTQPEVLTLVILEEFDSAIKDYGQEPFLVLLDGQIQKDSVIYLATTNYVDKIPARLKRPGRFSSIIEVGTPNAQARRMYLETKLGTEYVEMDSWVHHTESLTIDELKEMVQAVEILGNDFKETLDRIKSLSDVPEDDEGDDVFNEGNYVRNALSELFNSPYELKSSPKKKKGLLG